MIDDDDWTATGLLIKQTFLLVAGITRLPVLEGEVSHVEIPRTSSSLGMTIVGGADTPLVSHKLNRKSVQLWMKL